MYDGMAGPEAGSRKTFAVLLVLWVLSGPGPGAAIGLDGGMKIPGRASKFSTEGFIIYGYC